jgi:hypothetical protein
VRSKEIAMRTYSSTATQGDRNSGLPAHPDRAALVLSVIVGAAMGIGLGFFSMAGWFAVVLGFVLGAAAGALVGKLTLAREHDRAAKDRVFDRETGVIP